MHSFYYEPHEFLGVLLSLAKLFLDSSLDPCGSVGLAACEATSYEHIGKCSGQCCLILMSFRWEFTQEVVVQEGRGQQRLQN